MRTTILTCIWLFCHHHAFSQGNSSVFQTWMKGDNTIGQAGIYGARGIPDASNKPGARDFSATWRDTDGNLWLFGGYGLDGSGNLGYLNDLWKFDPVVNTWTWMKGDNVIEQPGVYGQQGTANDINKPGGVYAGVCWTDAGGNFWLFGGYGYTSSGLGFLNDLWKFDPTANRWTWIKGDGDPDQPGNYGTQGVAHSNNKPGARYGSRTWTDNDNNLWLFGGYGYDNNISGSLNDLWKYNPATNKWTWVNGDKIINQPGVYGSKGTGAAANKPGARFVSISWTDNNNNLWLFGGFGFASSAEGELNDLWKFNISTNEWTWINGDNTINQHGLYGTLNAADATSKPGARYVSVSWTDVNNALWLFGGYGFDKNAEGYLNDLWKYEPSTDKWAWMKGDSTKNHTGIYGTQGMPTISNKSGARTSCVSWTDNNGHLWLYGGYGYDASTSGMLNDLWKISSFIVLPVQLNEFSGTLKDDIASLQWQSEQELNFSHFIILRSDDGIHFDSIATITGKGGAEMNVYHYNDNYLPNRNTEKIFYRLRMINIDGSAVYSRIIRFDRKQLTGINVYPNPASGSLNLSLNEKTPGMVRINITDLRGRTVKTQIENIMAGRKNISIDINSLPSAGYILSVISATSVSGQQFIKQ